MDEVTMLYRFKVWTEPTYSRIEMIVTAQDERKCNQRADLVMRRRGYRHWTSERQRTVTWNAEGVDGVAITNTEDDLT